MPLGYPANAVLGSGIEFCCPFIFLIGLRTLNQFFKKSIMNIQFNEPLPEYPLKSNKDSKNFRQKPLVQECKISDK